MANSKDDSARAYIKTLIGFTYLVGKIHPMGSSWVWRLCVYDNNYNIKTVTRTKYVTVPGFVDPDLEEQKREGPAPDHPPADE
jgi:hypothetical protein